MHYAAMVYNHCEAKDMQRSSMEEKLQTFITIWLYVTAVRSPVPAQSEKMALFYP